ncbi:uncharacterized protein si:ch73-109d9.1 isoform X2 [Electrophorus electricus]|uniref:uncharacterized protein si:ch73-109d9.1 isoform X2 n=1 Tax=Electrophorus electricus TaxID=8005 RepID=UPI0015D05243|nr:uncharacterized protein si:ch73-109d9.1 isoform X2 [Electrophorus electricus]
MSDTLVVTFQAQLSIVMETILKSAMMEITRLVEDSFVEEVSRGKQEVALLMRRLQFAENKLKERRVRCADCGRATASSERTADHTEETLTGTDTLCVSLSLREQSEKRPTFSEVWRSDESLDLHISTEARARTEKTDTLEQSGKQDSASNNTAQLPPSVLQKLVPSAAVTRIHDPCTDLKPRESHCKTPVIDLSPIKDTDSAQSRLIQNGIGDSGCGELASSLSGPTVKSELEPDPVPIKEEEEMLPVWDYSDGSGPAETDQSHRGIGGPWNREETQLVQMAPENPATELVRMYPTNRQRTFSVVAREILTQFQVWQRACYSRNIEWGPITAKIISALPYLSGRETEVIVRCTKMLHNRRDYLRRRAKLGGNVL